MTGFLEQFCTMTLPYYYLSRHDRIALIDEILYYSDGLIAGEFDGKSRKSLPIARKVRI